MNPYYIFLIDIMFIINTSCIVTSDNSLSELRGGHHKGRPRPCGRSLPNPEGRTFFDWSVEFLDVNYNYNYNYNCGGNLPLAGTPVRPISQAANHLTNHFQLGNRPQQGGGIFGGLGLFPLLFGGGSASQSTSQSSSSSQSTAGGVGVAVPQDPVLPDRTPPRYRPGTYVRVSNPLFGTYTQDLSNINPNRIIRQFDREINKLVRPLYSLF